MTRTDATRTATKAAAKSGTTPARTRAKTPTHASDSPGQDNPAAKAPKTVKTAVRNTARPMAKAPAKGTGSATAPKAAQPKTPQTKTSGPKTSRAKTGAGSPSTPSARTPAKPVSSFGSARFINRETSWLEFNQRVLEEATNLTHPLLERLRFLAISGSNLDEFYMVRVAGLRAITRSEVTALSIDGLNADEQLAAVNARAGALLAEQGKIWSKLRAELRANGIALLDGHELTRAERTWLRGYFDDHVWPVLTPAAVDSAHPFPFIANLGFGHAAELQSEDGSVLHVLTLIPNTVPRFITLPPRRGARDAGRPGKAGDIRSVAVETLITECMDQIYPGYTLRASGAFRIIRDTDIEVQDEAEDLVAFFETALKKRDKGALVFLNLDGAMPPSLRQFVIEALEDDGEEVADVADTDGILGIKDVSKLIPKSRSDLVFSPYTPRSPARVRDYGGDVFAAVRAKDLLLHHPYETFDTVVDFVRQAARDPQVVAIKQTLYRTSNGSPIVKALCEAADAGKSVTAIVELKARFDEEHNIGVARDLEAAGVQVVYGFVEFKTHAKLSLVVRREGDGLRSYTHVGTGNYHPQTAKLYTDVSVFTTDAGVARDAGKVFNYITGYAPPANLEKLTVSPSTLKARFIELTETEAANARAGKPAMIWAKMNSLAHPEVIDALYRASQAGTTIHLIVRGVCCLRPGVPGLSENIHVKSIIGRYLEHSRIYAFANGHAMPSEKNIVLISSADLMPRNLDRRVEVMAPLDHPTTKRQALNQIMHANVNDEAHSWYLNTDATYTRFDTSHLDTPFSLHEHFMNTPSYSGLGRADDAQLPADFQHIGPRQPTIGA